MDYAIEFLTSPIENKYIEARQKEGCEKIMIGPDSAQMKEKLLNIRELNDKNWANLFLESNTAPPNYLEQWSLMIKTFRAEFTFNDNNNDIQYELFVLFGFNYK